jgi:hypothetical protein
MKGHVECQVFSKPETEVDGMKDPQKKKKAKAHSFDEPSLKMNFPGPNSA